ncbi:MAG: FAD-dependent monooxygenase [Caulobacteraceae bacterium]|nr:FAD-dependent monooxygenase [Caulobacter sp.]
MTEVLIVGAGPTGLAAALFLTRAGVACRVVDKLDKPTSWSKALAVNPRTLELLEPTGVTARVLAEGRPVETFELTRGGRTLAAMDLRELGAKHPMTALPQSRSEELLADALGGLGVRPERGVELKGFHQDEAAVHAVLAHPDGREEAVDAPLMLCADGAHSTGRHVLDIGFPGHAFPEPWKLADVRLAEPVDVSSGFVQLHDHGFVFSLAFDPSYWRVICNFDDPLNHVPGGAAVREVVWASEFHISHRIAERLAVGRVALAGDAAHLHSPVGARGMNLGIEDAYVFAHFAQARLRGQADALERYGRLRHEADAGVVHRVEAISRMARGEGVWSLVRKVAPHVAGSVPLARKLMLETVTGLDHPVKLS